MKKFLCTLVVFLAIPTVAAALCYLAILIPEEYAPYILASPFAVVGLVLLWELADATCDEIRRTFNKD